MCEPSMMMAACSLLFRFVCLTLVLFIGALCFLLVCLCRRWNSSPILVLSMISSTRWNGVSNMRRMHLFNRMRRIYVQPVQIRIIISNNRNHHHTHQRRHHHHPHPHLRPKWRRSHPTQTTRINDTVSRVRVRETPAKYHTCLRISRFQSAASCYLQFNRYVSTFFFEL